MAFFDDFANAVSNYPSDSVTLSIVDRAPVPPATAGTVNVNEVWRFQVRVTNSGNLNLTSVSLHIAGLNGATVSLLATGPFVPDIFPPALPAVNAHGSQDTGNLFFKAPGIPRAGALVSAHIHAFDVNLDHILAGHSGNAEQPSGVYADQVLA